MFDLSVLRGAPSPATLAQLEALDSASPEAPVLLEAVVAWQRLLSRAQAGLWEAVAAFAQHRPRVEDEDPGATWDPSVSSFATSELAAALNLPLSSADRLAGEAVSHLRTYPELVASLRRGALTRSRLRILTDTLDPLGPEDRETVLRELLPLAEGTLPNGALRQRARRAVIAQDPDVAARRAEAAARRETRVTLYAREDAMATLVTTAPAIDLVAVHAAIDAFARTLRAHGSEGTLSRLRATALHELILTHPAITGLQAWQQTLHPDPHGSRLSCDSTATTSGRAPHPAVEAAASPAAVDASEATPHTSGSTSSSASSSASMTVQDFLDETAEVPWPSLPPDDRPYDCAHYREAKIEDDPRRWTRAPDDDWYDEQPLGADLAEPLSRLRSLAADDSHPGPSGPWSRPGVRPDGTLALGVPLDAIPTLGLGSAGRLTALTLVAIPYDVLLGTSDAPGELAGYGPLPAPLARAIAEDPHGTWQRLVTDPLTGSVQDFGTTRYRPPAKLAGHVIARDWTCRAPGCNAPATTCDLDHVTPYGQEGGGPTCAENLIPLCRRHHRAKTFAAWSARRRPDGSVQWTTPTGHRYVTQPQGPLRATR